MSIILVFFLGLSTWAGGTSINGGGGGVTINNQIYLLDFYEQGIHQNPYVGSKSSATVKNYALLKTGLNSVPLESLELAFAKINDIALIDPVLAAFIEKAIFTIHWNFSAEEILKTDDTNSCSFNIKSEQLALRQGNLVNVDLAKFSQMDNVNQAGLIIHEALQSLMPENPRDICHHRRTVALLFTKSFFRGGKDFWNETLKSYPTAFEIFKIYPKLNELRIEKFFFYSRKAVKTSFWNIPGSSTRDNEPVDIINWLLFPSVDLQFSEEENTLNQSVGSISLRKNFCSMESSLTNFTLKYWDVSLTPRYNEQGQAVSRFNWALKESEFISWDQEQLCRDQESNMKSFLVWEKEIETWRF